MTALNEMTIAAARDALGRGEITSVELTEACLAAVEGADALIARTDQATMEMQRLDGMMDNLTAELSTPSRG